MKKIRQLIAQSDKQQVKDTVFEAVGEALAQPTTVPVSAAPSVPAAPVTPAGKQTGAGVKIRELNAQLDEMLDRSKSIDPNVYQKQAIALRRDALDEFTRRCLSDHRFNQLYSEIDNVKFLFVERLDGEKSQVEALVRSCY